MTQPCRPCRGARGRTEATWDEREHGCCKQPNVGDVDPAMHPCATVPDLTGLDWPPVRLGWTRPKVGACDLARGCPRVEPCYERARPTGRELLVLKSRRGERVSFYGAGRKARQSPSPKSGRRTWTLITCLVQPGCCNRDAKLGGVVEKQGSRVPIITIKRRGKSSTETVHALTSEAIYGFGVPLRCYRGDD